MKRPLIQQPFARHGERGTASVEFALIATIMIVILLGLFVYWRAFQAQQSLTRAAGDGARAAHSMIAIGIYDPCHPSKAATNRALISQRVGQFVTRSLEQSAMPGTVTQQLTISSLQWACPASGNASVSFELTYLLPPLLGNMGTWIAEPTRVYEKSVMHFASMV